MKKTTSPYSLLKKFIIAKLGDKLVGYEAAFDATQNLL